MASSSFMTLTSLLVTLCLMTLTQGQRTEVDKGTCTYSFVIPQTDLVSTCKSYSSQQVENLQKKIDILQEKVDNMSGRKRNATGTANAGAFSCSCDNSTTFDFAYSDCDDVKMTTDGVSGLYKIDPINSTGALIEVKTVKNSSKYGSQRYWVVETWGEVTVFCDLEDEEVGWTILMRRSKMDVSFDRDWYDYKWGFGNKDASGDFWLGLEHMHRITSQMKKQYSLWVVIVDGKKVPHIFPYGQFRIDSEATNYTMKLDDYHGQGPSRLFDGRQFMTKDYGPNLNCAMSRPSYKVNGGGWWFASTSSYYYSCGYVNLNAPEPYWSDFDDIKSVVIKIKPSVK